MRTTWLRPFLLGFLFLSLSTISFGQTKDCSESTCDKAFENVLKSDGCLLIEAAINNKPEIISDVIAGFVAGCTNLEYHCEMQRGGMLCKKQISTEIVGTRESSGGEYAENDCPVRGRNVADGGCFTTEVVNTKDCYNLKAGACRNTAQCNDEGDLFGSFVAMCHSGDDPGCKDVIGVVAEIRSTAYSRHASYLGRVNGIIQSVIAPLSDEQKSEILSQIEGIWMFSNDPETVCYETYLEGAIDWSAGAAQASSATETTQSGGEDSDELEPEPELEPAAEAGYMIEVAVSADGFEPSTVFAPCSIEPSSVRVSGVVTDDDGQPVSGARVSLVGLGAVTATGPMGSYSLAVQTEGDEPFSADRDVMIVRLLTDLRATVTPSSTVWANGREYEAVLTVTSEGRPLANKEITVTDWKGFSHNGRTIDYVTARRGNNIPLRLDDGGQIRFQFEAPIVPRGKGATIEDPANLFPVDGHFRVMVRGQVAETSCDYRIESPFPKIGQIRVPGNVDAGLWQVSPSSIVVDDPDSSRFRVTVRGLGDFRTTQPGAATKKGALTHDLTGDRFEFLYRPPREGLDPTAMPDVLDQFMNTSKNIYISVATNVAGGMLLEKVQIQFPNDAFGKGLSKIGLELDAGKLLDAGGNMANVVNLGSATYLDGTMVSEDPDVQKTIVAGGNLIIGVIDTGMGFKGTLGTAQQKLAWEAAKAYWEYLKLINSVSGQYHELADAYQGTVFHPILVTIKDESGHRATASRACSVRVWKGGSQ